MALRRALRRPLCVYREAGTEYWVGTYEQGRWRLGDLMPD
jgi:hypothetical protein